MGENAYITSRQNEQIKNLVKLRERKHRDRQSKFIVEGLREIGHALTAGYTFETIYYCPEHFPSRQHEEFLEKMRRDGLIRLTQLSPEAFDKANFREGPDGLLALVQQQSTVLEDLKIDTPPLLLVLEGIEKPGNLGAILRSADGSGADAVILVDCVLDLYNPNAIRSSQGLIFALPIVTTAREPLKAWLASKGIQIIATTPDTDQLHWDANYKTGAALFLGSESDGLTQAWLDDADTRIRIPMSGQADSLNVAAAAAVCLYEARRQRTSDAPASRLETNHSSMTM